MVCCGAGIDAALAHALTVSPLTRGPKDEDVLLSDAVCGVVGLIQARMRWPGAAQVTLAATTVPNVDKSNSALLGLLKQLYMGTDDRYSHSQACSTHNHYVPRPTHPHGANLAPSSYLLPMTWPSVRLPCYR